MWLVALLAALTACGGLESAGQGAKAVGGFLGGTAVEYTFCEIGLVDCGHVFICATPADNELSWIEICVDDDEPGLLEQAEAMYGMCEPTPRHQGICISQCDEPSPLPGGRGANAFNGEFCGAP